MAPVSSVAIAAVSAGLLSVTARVFHFRISLTDSAAPAGIYRLIAAPAGRGALVAACLPAQIARAGLARGYLRQGDCPAGAEPVGKVIGALPGDVIELSPERVEVNGVPLANSPSAARDSAGRPLPHTAWGTRHVDPGQVWLFGSNDARSRDRALFRTGSTRRSARGAQAGREVVRGYERPHARAGTSGPSFGQSRRLIAIASLDREPPDFLLGALISLAHERDALTSEERAKVVSLGHQKLNERATAKRAWKSWQRLQELHSLTLSSAQIGRVIEALGERAPDNPAGLIDRRPSEFADG